MRPAMFYLRGDGYDYGDSIGYSIPVRSSCFMAVYEVKDRFRYDPSQI